MFWPPDTALPGRILEHAGRIQTKAGARIDNGADALKREPESASVGSVNECVSRKG